MGENTSGHVGDGTKEDRTSPQKIAENVLAVDFSGSHGCFINEGHDVFCWGDNTFGQLGYGVIGEPELTPVPTTSPKATQVAVSTLTSCVLSLEHEVYCWGANNLFQLHDGTTEPSSAPHLIPLESAAEEIFVGASSVCARLKNKFVCWGNNSWGQFADGKPEISNNFHEPSSSPEIVSVAMANEFACYLMKDQKVFCAGRNQVGQLGNGTTDSLVEFAAPVGVPPAIALGNGAYFACALTVDGEVYCWGNNETFQMGTGEDGVLGEPHLSPTKVPEIAHGESLYVGNFSACVMTKEKNLVCWGYGGPGLLESPSPPKKIFW